jgi:hypothetical protein
VARPASLANWRIEEQAVLSIQAMARSCHVDLVKLAVAAAERDNGECP